MEPMLKVTDLAVSYGHVEALRGINVEVHKGQIVSIIGANGAGKTTVFNLLTGFYPSPLLPAPLASAKPRCCARFQAW